MLLCKTPSEGLTKPVARKGRFLRQHLHILHSFILKGNVDEIKSLLTCFSFYFKEFELKFQLIVFKTHQLLCLEKFLPQNPGEN